jgi:DNA-binding SARP family transcriptional activator
MEFRILGPLEVLRGSEQIALGRRRGERCLLGLLLLDAGEVVPLDRLVDLLWDGDPPVTARGTVMTHIARLRSLLDPHRDGRLGVRIVRIGDGYLIDVGAATVDIRRFRELYERARNTAGVAEQAALLREALQLWRGPLLADVASERLRQRAATGLDELRLSVLESWADAELACGRTSHVIAALTDPVRRQPQRERLVGALMLALHQEGRQAEALTVYRRTHDLLGEQLGLEPEPDLRRLHAWIAQEEPTHAVPPRDTAQPPMPAGPFTGLPDAVRRLDAILAAHAGDLGPTVVVISAAAGAGKSTLAVHWGRRARRQFPDGQLHVDLRGRTAASALRPIEALTVLLRALGLPADRVPTDVDQAACVYRSSVAGRRLLLVLDDARDPEQVRPLLPGDPGIMVLITSRNRLGGLVAIEGAHRLNCDTAHSLLSAP